MNRDKIIQTANEWSLDAEITRMSQGLLLQTWTATTTANGSTTVMFPVTFPNLCITVVMSHDSPSELGYKSDVVGISNISILSFQVLAGQNDSESFKYLVIGY
jgi:hypothetical protein